MDFLKKMKQSIEEGILEREKVKKELGEKSVVPSEVIDYEVEE